ncbi:MAG: transposase [Polyangiaceae bacterium]|nr:transposase [Polyangiaceae bacterium]
MATADERISRLEAQVAHLLEVLAARDAEIARLKGRVAELERQLGQNSTNSHKPPSSDPPGTRPSKEASGRKRGGQAGHKGHKRVLLPAEKVTKRTEVRPRACHGCGGHDLTPSELAPRIHQVVDIPEIRPDVHEVRMHAASCRGCGRTTWARLPGKVPAHMFGPRLQAFIGYLIGSRMSRRQVRELLGEVFGIPVSLGALSEAEARTSAALAEPVAEAEAFVRAQPVKHVDASTWRLHGKYAALWTITTRFVAAFFVARTPPGKPSRP